MTPNEAPILSHLSGAWSVAGGVIAASEGAVRTDFQSQLRLALDALALAAKDNDCFLTVLLRTQGHRLETLRDSLLSLAGQTDRDFEVLILAHDVEPDSKDRLERIIAEYDALLPAPARLISIEGGTRAKPLNVGLSQARGEYVAFYDDDDLLFANWVEAFRSEAERSPGKLLRANTAVQRIEPEEWPSGSAGFQTLSWPTVEYAALFNQLDHIERNHSPFMSIAFPRIMYTQFGITADETLDVCEDWDLLLRGASTLGLADVRQLTSIYRRWQGGTSSYTRHDEDAWRRSEKRVIDRLNDTGVFLAPGQIDRIRELLRNQHAPQTLEEIVNSTSWRLTKPLRSALIAAKLLRRRVRAKAARVLRRR